MGNVNVTLRLDKDKVALLDQFAQSDDRDRTYPDQDAIDRLSPDAQWQIDEIRKAIAEADAGDFASEEEVKRMFAQAHPMKVRWLKRGHAFATERHHAHIALDNPCRRPPRRSTDSGPR